MVHFFIVSALTKWSICDITFKKIIMNDTLFECLVNIYSFIYNYTGLNSHSVSENLHRFLIRVVHICYSTIPSKNIKTITLHYKIVTQQQSIFCILIYIIKIIYNYNPSSLVASPFQSLPDFFSKDNTMLETSLSYCLVLFICEHFCKNHSNIYSV